MNEERIVKPFDEGDTHRRLTIRLNFVPWTIANSLAKADGRTVQQWLSRFLNDALEKMFQDESARISAQRDSERRAFEREIDSHADEVFNAINRPAQEKP